MMSLTPFPLKKHEEWCCDYLHFVKEHEGGEKGVRGSKEWEKRGLEGARSACWG